jgi:glycosyltransferase involved in cell wall biosynthesis
MPSPPLISFIVPAHNEERLLGASLDALNAARRMLGETSELIVVDDASTDRTAEVAREKDARVVRVDLRHIAAVRNAGAREAKGELLVFVDADTLAPADVLRAAVDAFNGGAVGGGAAVKTTDDAPAWTRRAFAFTSTTMALMRWAAGCFVYARRDAFERAGGFDERYFATEEIHLSRALKRIGPVVIVPQAVITSARKADAYSLPHTAWLLVKLLALPGSLKRRDRLGFWYEGRS